VTIRIGPIDKVTVHLATTPDADTLPRSLCMDGGAPIGAVRTLSIFTRDAGAVTCPDCIEWMHA
jgi:hypothetical protein